MGCDGTVRVQRVGSNPRGCIWIIGAQDGVCGRPGNIRLEKPDGVRYDQIRDGVGSRKTFEAVVGDGRYTGKGANVLRDAIVKDRRDLRNRQYGLVDGDLIISNIAHIHAIVNIPHPESRFVKGK